MAVDQAAVTVGTDPTPLWEVEAGAPDGESLLVTNISTDTDVWVGNANVTADDGTPVRHSDGQIGLDLAAAEKLFGVVASGSAEVRVLRQGI